MEAGNPDILEQIPTTGNPMKPTSGTYGDVKKTEDLKAQLDLPQGPGPGGPGGPSGPALGGSGGGMGMPRPAGPSQPGVLPDALMSPTAMPDVPQGTPLRSAARPVASQPQVNHIAVLTALVASPTASDTTKRWAETLLERYRS